MNDNLGRQFRDQDGKVIGMFYPDTPDMRAKLVEERLAESNINLPPRSSVPTLRRKRWWQR